MRRNLVFGVIFLGVLIVGLALSFFWRRQTVLARKPLSPVSLPDTVTTLSSQLEKAGLALAGSPAVLGETITASISGARVLFAANASLDTQIRALQLVLPRLKMESRQITEIDLRFNKVVVR